MRGLAWFRRRPALTNLPLKRSKHCPCPPRLPFPPKVPFSPQKATSSPRGTIPLKRCKRSPRETGDIVLERCVRLTLTPAVAAAPCANLAFAVHNVISTALCLAMPPPKEHPRKLTNLRPLSCTPTGSCSRPAHTPTRSWAQTSPIPLTGGRSRTGRRRIVPIPPRGREGSCRRFLHGQSLIWIAPPWVGGRGRRLLRGRRPGEILNQHVGDSVSGFDSSLCGDQGLGIDCGRTFYLFISSKVETGQLVHLCESLAIVACWSVPKPLPRSPRSGLMIKPDGIL